MWLARKISAAREEPIRRKFLYDTGRIYVFRKLVLQRFNIRTVAIGTLRRRLFVDDHGLGVNHARLPMALVAGDAGVATLQGEMCPRVVVEGRGNPALRIVTVRTGRRPGLCELAVMSVLVTIFANLRRALELYLLLADRHFVAITALGGAVRSE